MTKISMVVMIIIALITGVTGLLPALASEPVATVPGNTVVQDDDGDLLLVNLVAGKYGFPCTIPALGYSEPVPKWLDIKTAHITQLNKNRVKLQMSLQEPVPPEIASGSEPIPFDIGGVGYIWQFEGGCIGGVGGAKDSVTVWWNRGEGKWEAYWWVVVSCGPRTIVKGDPVDFRFTDDGVQVEVDLDDLMLAAEDGVVTWYAAVRRLPFIWGGYNTIAVDWAPNVIAWNPDLLPPSWLPDPHDPYLIHPEPSATWTPRR